MVKGVLFIVHVDASKRRRYADEIYVEEWLDFRGAIADAMHEYTTTRKRKRLETYFDKEPEVPKTVASREEIIDEIHDLTEENPEFSKKFFSLFREFLVKFLVKGERMRIQESSLRTALDDEEVMKMIYYGMGVAIHIARQKAGLLLSILIKKKIPHKDLDAMDPLCLSFHPLIDIVQDEFLLYLLEHEEEIKKIKGVPGVLEKVRHWKRFLDLAAKEVRRMYSGIRKIVEIAEDNDIQVIFLPGGPLETIEYKKSPYELAKIVEEHQRNQPRVGFYMLGGHVGTLQRLWGKLPVFFLGCYAELCITEVNSQLEILKPKGERYLFTWPYTIFAYEKSWKEMETLHKKKGLKIINIKKFRKIVKEL